MNGTPTTIPERKITEAFRQLLEANTEAGQAAAAFAEADDGDIHAYYAEYLRKSWFARGYVKALTDLGLIEEN